LSDQDDPIPFDRSMNARADDMQAVSPLVRRLIANNGGPFTFTGTCTYVVGRGDVAVIDPGPADPMHTAALLAALQGETVRHILVTHTHRDHSPGAIALQAATGATIVGCAPYRPAASPPDGDRHPTDASHDLGYKADRILQDGDRISGPGYDLFAVATPGHAANHLCFSLPQENALFSGDHVMAWSTTVVAPPDGSMRAYMASLEKLRTRDDAIYWPGHGGPVRNPQRFVKALAQHRRHREHAILHRLAAGDALVETLVARLYADLSPSLKGAAALSVLAHLQDLVERGVVVVNGPPTLQAHYAPA
jgi:glyoxylase-like metal-dependent hydrolase (beta-lactamase superfamily II)